MTAIPLGGMVVLSQMEDPLRAAAEEEPAVFAEPVSETIDGAMPVQVNLTWVEGAQLLAPAWNGTVTQVRAVPGTEASTGAPLLDIDGRTRVAAATVQPFWRSLTPTDTGSDVAMLNSLLDDLGLRHGGDRWTSGTTEGVKSFQTKFVGVPRTESVTAFDPSWLVWLPSERFVIGNIAVSVGQPAPALGEPLAVEAPRLAGAEIASLEGDALVLDLAHSWRLSTELGEAFDLIDAKFTPEDLLRLEVGLPADTESLLGAVAYAAPLEVMSVPPAAVVASEGKTCIWVRSGGSEVVSETVTVAGGSVGVTYLRDRLAAGVEVLVNPAIVLEDAKCT